MSLQSVAARMEALCQQSINVHWRSGARTVISEFEADPEFTAPERLKESERQLAEARGRIVVLEDLARFVASHPGATPALSDSARRALGGGK